MIMKRILENKYSRILILVGLLPILLGITCGMNCEVSSNTKDTDNDAIYYEVDYPTVIEDNIVVAYIDENKLYKTKEEVLLAEVRENAKLIPPVNLYDISHSSNMTKDQLRKVITETMIRVNHTGSSLESIVDSLYNMEQEYDVNALFALSVASLESGWGASYAATHKNNLFGMYCGTSTASSFESLDANVNAFGKLIRERYINRGLTTTYSIGPVYCTTPSWAGNITNIMNKYINVAEEITNIK